MEFHKKLQELRKSKGLTQEELAQALYVSRTAISKWESGRGYPNTESLKAMARFFSVSLDSLLSADEALTLAAEESKRREARFRSLVYGLLDISLVLLLFLPLFREAVGEEVLSVSLFALAEVQAYLKILYILGIVGISLVGLLTVALQNKEIFFWERSKTVLSLTWGVVLVLLFTVSLQPYAASLSFVLLAVKAFFGARA